MGNWCTEAPRTQTHAHIPPHTHTHTPDCRLQSCQRANHRPRLSIAARSTVRQTLCTQTLTSAMAQRARAPPFAENQGKPVAQASRRLLHRDFGESFVALREPAPDRNSTDKCRPLRKMAGHTQTNKAHHSDEPFHGARSFGCAIAGGLALIAPTTPVLLLSVEHGGAF